MRHRHTVAYVTLAATFAFALHLDAEHQANRIAVMATKQAATIRANQIAGCERGNDLRRDLNRRVPGARLALVPCKDVY